MVKNFLVIVSVITVVVVVVIYALRVSLPLGPVVLLLAFLPLLVIVILKQSLVRIVPDLVFGVIDTGLLTIPALIGGFTFGVAGAIAGGVIGDAVTDAIAGFFEGHIASWLRQHGFNESREALTTSIGKMSGCLFGCGIVLTVALLFGVAPESAQLLR